MDLMELAAKIGASVLTPANCAGVEIKRVYAGDRISDLLGHATPATLLVTNLAGPQVLRVAGLMEAPAICLLNGQMPDDDLLTEAAEHHVVLLSSPAGMFETRGLLHRCLGGEGGIDA